MLKMCKYLFGILFCSVFIYVAQNVFLSNLISQNLAKIVLNASLATSELPIWIISIIGCFIFVRFIYILWNSSFHSGTDYMLYFIMIFFLSSCAAFTGRCTNPSPKDWTEKCEFYAPKMVNFELDIITYGRLASQIYGNTLSNVNVTCKVVKVARLPHPDIQDSCYWTSEIVTILTGTSNAQGHFLTNFDFTYGSTADYFILEYAVEKAGWYRQLGSSDHRYYAVGSDEQTTWVPNSTPTSELGPNRQIVVGTSMEQNNTNP
jgi:hypothetical protein